MNLKNSALLPALIGMAALVSCSVDDGYDFDNLDKSSRFHVDNLTLPLNLDDVTLNNIITFDDDSKIKKVTINGQEVYALTETGDFESDAIYIDKVSARAPQISPVHAQLLPTALPHRAAGKAIDLSDLAVTYAIENLGRDFTYDIRNIDEAIVDIKSIETEPMRFCLSLTIASQLAAYEKITFSNLKMRMPKGLNANVSTGTYDNATGIWTIDEYSPAGATADIWIEAQNIDFKANGASIKNHEMQFSSGLFVESGYITITPQLTGGIPSELPTSLDFTISFNVSDISAKSFTGTVNYKIDGVNIDPVSLSDIPDFLNGEGTTLGLANPQIYLQLNNPVAGDKLTCETGIELTANRQGYNIDFTPNDNKKIVIGCNYGVDGPYNFVMAPDRDKLAVPSMFDSNLDFIQFTGLRELLMPDPNVNSHLGLPESIGIHLDNPQIPTQDVNKFTIGRNLPGVKGHYELLAPLALTANSGIVYSDKETDFGISTEDGNLVIEKMGVTLTVSNGAPIGFELTAYPLDKNGNRINNVNIVASRIEANTDNQDVEISISGEINGMDGIEYVAQGFSDGSEETLKPDMKITLSDIRITVSGYYDYYDTDYKN